MLEYNHTVGIETEPVAVGGAITAFVAASLAVAMAFGLPVTNEHVGYILAALSALIVLVTAIQRRKVVPLTKLDEREAL